MNLVRAPKGGGGWFGLYKSTIDIIKGDASLVADEAECHRVRQL